MRRRRSQEALSPACRFRGASARATTTWGLSSRLAPRSLRNRRRAARVRRAQRGPPNPSLSPGDPGGRRIVAAKLLAGRHVLLERRAARRMRVPYAALGHGPARGRACASGSATVLADGRARGGLRLANRTQNPTRPVGRERRLYAFYARGRRCVAARSGRDRGSLRHRDRAGSAARHG